MFPSSLPAIGVRTVERSADDDWRREFDHELDRPLMRDSGPLARLVWVRAGNRSDLILVVDHVICDGQSVLILMRELIGRLSGHDEVPRAPPGFGTLDELFGPPRRRAAVGMRAIAALGAPVLWAKGARTRRHRGSALPPSYVMHRVVDEACADRLAERTRSEKVTIYAALATAVLVAYRAMHPSGSFNRMICPVDPRPFFAIRSSNLLFSTPSHVALSLPKGLDEQFWEQARRLGADLLAGYVGLRPDRTARLGERLHPLIDGAVTRALHGPRTNDLTLSHLGDAWLPSGPDGAAEALATVGSSPWADATAIMSLASGGRLRLCLVSREGVLPRDDAERLWSRAMDVLARALGGAGMNAGA